jgi:hypothetical protein
MKQIIGIGFICNILLSFNILAMKKTDPILPLRPNINYRELDSDINLKMAAANKLYDQRNDMGMLKSAQNIYLGVIKDIKAPLNDRREALERYGRLALYAGAIARQHYSLGNDKTADLFESCIDATKSLSPKKLKAHAVEYYYWRASCIGLYLVNINIAKALVHASKFNEMKELVDYGLKNFRPYEDYGFNRIKAGLLYKTKEAPKILKLYNPNEALVLTEEAIEKGYNNYASHFMKAEILVELRQPKEALKVLDEGILELDQRFLENSIPQDLALENGWFMEDMKALKYKLST